MIAAERRVERKTWRGGLNAKIGRQLIGNGVGIEIGIIKFNRLLALFHFWRNIFAAFHQIGPQEKARHDGARSITRQLELDRQRNFGAFALGVGKVGAHEAKARHVDLLAQPVFTVTRRALGQSPRHAILLVTRVARAHFRDGIANTSSLRSLLQSSTVQGIVNPAT